MKKFFLPLLIAGFTFSIFSCNNDPSMEVENLKEVRFTQLELNQISDLKDLLPKSVITDFEDKYLEWKKTWSRPEMAVVNDLRDFAKSDEYDRLLKYCQKYDKAIWPLIFEKLGQEVIYIANLLEHLTLPENKPLYDTIVSNHKLEVVIKPLPSSLSVWTDYSKKLLSKYYDNMLTSIQGISISEEFGNQIAALKDLLPETVINDFDEKYMVWVNTWSRYIIHSDLRKYAESDEYYDLLRYCQKYDKAIWPLVFEKLGQEDPFLVIYMLLEDLSFPVYEYLYDDISSKLGVKINWLIVLTEYCKALFSIEYDNIIKLIQNVSVPYESHFSESELNQIEALKVLLPTNILADFEEKFWAWENQWSLGYTRTYIRLNTKLPPYEDLLKYCQKNGKAIWPLIFEKLGPEDPFSTVTVLLEDLTFPENRHLYDEIESKLISENSPFSKLSLWTDYCKKLLSTKYENI